MKTWISAYMYKYVVSFHSCSLWHWLKNIIILYYYYIFLPYTLNFQSTVQNVATVFQSYNGRDWLPERGIVHLNASPECISSFPGTDQNSSLLHVIKLYWDFIPFDIAEHELEWVGLCEMRRLHRLSITGIYARIGLGLRLSRACTNKSDWLIRGRWIPGMQLNERPNPLRLAERLSPSKQLTSTKWSKVHILSLITKNCLSWISGKRRNTIYSISWLMRCKLQV